jgi:predicted secreted Zn-dependent protease
MDGGLLVFRRLAALAALVVAASPARAREADQALLHKACRNEIALFCSAASSSTLVSCLAEYRGSATSSCAAAIKDQATDVRAARAWGSVATSVVASSASAAPSAAAAGDFALSFVEKTSTYAVRGARPADLVAAMSASGLTDSVDGSRGAAQTGYSATFKYDRAARAGGCALTGARVSLTVTQTYPRWERPAAVEPASEEWWGKALASMHAHEDGHKRIDVELAGDFLKRLKSLSLLPTCADVDAAVKGFYRTFQLEARERNAAYDRETRHGQAQGPGGQASAR